ncbi:YhdP family protein [Allochromatium tepidum]|uniref:YhdP central domain-containing protein n=1 Tax=Allochromatium tepidum TaxID=553982 RepID=A0ABN6GCW3_9GAMM|nr:DUF3971 domain-containing protein [Allochromatium tepidum]BCU07800.1 hypothetical protein Atep_24770 [Allochromatium tepidum]
MSLLRRLTALLTTSMLLGLVLLALLVSVLRLTPPLTGEYRDAIAGRLSERLGYRLSIGTLRLGLSGLQPRLRLEGVALDRPDDGTRAPALRAIELDLNLQASLLSRSVRISGITLVGARLVLERGEDGRLRVHGLDALASDDPRVLEGFLNRGRLDLIESEILFVDPARGGKQLRLVETRLRLENSGERHWLDLSARPVSPDPLVLATDEAPSGADEPCKPCLQLALRLNGPASDPRSWSGRGYLHLDVANLGLLLPAAVPAHGRLDTERADVESWLDFQAGRLEQALIRADLRGVRLASDETPGQTQTSDDAARERSPAWHLSGMARVRSQQSGWSARIAGLEAGFDDVAVSGLGLDLRLSPEGRLLGLGGRLAQLDLDDLSAMRRASPWPLPEALNSLLERHPRGSAHDLAVRFEPAGTGVESRWQVSGRLSGLGLDRRERQPGFAGLDLRFAGDQDGGWVRLGSEGLDLDLNPLFDRPLRLDQFSGRLDWTRRPSGGWRLAAHELALENADLSGQAHFALELPGADGRPFLDLRARFRDANAANVRLYLPVGIMKPQLVDWLDAAIVSGRVTQGDALFRGALADHPFRRRQGRFELKLEFEDLRLDYQPGWPAITSAAGHLRFLDEGLTIRVDRGRLLDSDFRAGRVDLPDLAHVEQMRIHGEARGPFEDGRRTLAETPLSEKLGGLAEILQVSGQSQLVLDIDLPFVKQRTLGVSGVLSWPAPATLGVRGTAIRLSGLSGAVRFDERGIQASKVGAKLSGRPLELSLRTQDSGLHLAGRIDALDLSDWSDWAKATQLGQSAAVKDGIALAGVEFDVDRLSLGERTLNAFKLRGTPGKSGWRFRVDAGEVAGLIRPADTDTGTRLDLDLERLDLKAFVAHPESAGPPTPRVSAPSPDRAPDPITELPSLDLRVARLDWGERALGTLDLSLHRDALGMRLPRLRLSRSGLLNIEGTGEWVRASEGGRSRLDLKAETPDLRGVLTLLDEPTAIEAKGARARVQLHWPGGPTRFAWARAEGVLDIGVDPGRLLEAEPGVGRLLGFIDIGSIGRRLALDFSDLYGQGFAFERLGGRIAIGQGRARFEDVSIEGPAGRVMVGGAADLVGRRLDQLVTVEPKLGTSLALAGAVAGGPVVGAAVYLVDRATGNTLDRLGRYQYRVTGPWTEPEWTRLGWEPLSGLGERREPANEDGKPPRPTNHFLDVP